MKDLDARQELLVITMEECGELIQACSKALRRGELFAHSDSESELKQEIADVYAMIELMQEFNIIGWTEIEKGADRKRKKLAQWSKLVNKDNVELGATETQRKGYEAGISMTAPPKTEQKEKNFPSNSVTWRQALDDEPKVVYAHTPPFTTPDSVNMTPMTEEEEREWDRIYQNQVKESQKNAKESQ